MGKMIRGTLHGTLKRGLLSALGVLLLLAGCAADPSVKPWWTLRDTNFRALQVGATTKAEARSMLGRPLVETNFANLGLEAWDYRFLDGTIIMYASVFFDTGGKYRYYTARPDDAFYSTNGP